MWSVPSMRKVLPRTVKSVSPFWGILVINHRKKRKRGRIRGKKKQGVKIDRENSSLVMKSHQSLIKI